MECPRCRTAFEPPICPQCGWTEPARERGPEHHSTPSVETVGAPDQLGPSPGWHDELREKIKRHQDYRLTRRIQTASRSRSKGAASTRKSLPSIGEPPGSTSPAAKQQSGSAPSPLDASLPGSKLGRYGLARESDRREPLPNKKIVTLKAPSPTRVPQKPLIRRSPGMRSIPGKGPHQKSLTLNPDRADAEAGGRASADAGAGKPGKEILFSRCLAGIIDLILAGAVGLGFALAAAGLLGVQFPTPEHLLLAGVCGFTVFFLDSVFFLALVQQTPGMASTGVRVVPMRGDQLSMIRVVVRVLAFVPTLLSLVGLFWSVIDSRHRCLHDLLSGTRVVAQARN